MGAWLIQSASHPRAGQVDSAEGASLLGSKMTAEEIYESITNGGASDFATVAGILDRHGPWCLIGGLAVNCYVEPVYTVDADVIVESKNLIVTRENFSRDNKLESKLEIHFMHDERYQNFIARANRQEVLGRMVPVAELRDIVQGKVWAWSDEKRRLSKRKKDELDLIRIAEAYADLLKDMPYEIQSQLEGGAR